MVRNAFAPSSSSEESKLGSAVVVGPPLEAAVVELPEAGTEDDVAFGPPLLEHAASTTRTATAVRRTLRRVEEGHGRLPQPARLVTAGRRPRSPQGHRLGDGR